MITTVSFEALTAGTSWRSPARTLTEAELSWSCMTSGDWHAIHADAEFAARSAAGQRMFQGSYGIHIAMGMATHLPELGNTVIAALGFKQWKFCAPLFVNDTVSVEVELLAKRATSDGLRGVLERGIRLVKSDGTVAQEGVLATLVLRKEGTK